MNTLEHEMNEHNHAHNEHAGFASYEENDSDHVYNKHEGKFDKIKDFGHKVSEVALNVKNSTEKLVKMSLSKEAFVGATLMLIASNTGLVDNVKHSIANIINPIEYNDTFNKPIDDIVITVKPGDTLENTVKTSLTNWAKEKGLKLGVELNEIPFNVIKELSNRLKGINNIEDVYTIHISEQFLDKKRQSRIFITIESTPDAKNTASYVVGSIVEKVENAIK